MIPDEILQVAAVVTGGERGTLTGWQREAAVAAMTALGYSGTHIQWTLGMTKRQVSHVAERVGITIHYADQRYDELAVQWVCNNGATMRLRGADAVEAIRRMAAAGRRSDDIGARIRASGGYVTRIASRHCITIPRLRAQAWWSPVAQPSAAGNHRRKSQVAA